MLGKWPLLPKIDGIKMAIYKKNVDSCVCRRNGNSVVVFVFRELIKTHSNEYLKICYTQLLFPDNGYTRLRLNSVSISVLVFLSLALTPIRSLACSLCI